MKKLILLLTFLSLCSTSFGQNLSNNQKLYYSCKVWGYAKYYHSEVSNCKVNWDSVLAETYPLIKSADTYDDFNNALMTMLEAAGTMKTATTDPPEELAENLRINLNHDWFDDPFIRDDLRAALNNIKENFRPAPNCYAINNNGSGYGWLAFPKDDPIIDDNLFENFPDEATRAAILFRYWNIINYFNPYNDILDNPWDSTLYNYSEDMVAAEDYTAFIQSIEYISAELCDAHVEGLTGSLLEYFMGDSFSPRLIIAPAKDEYAVVKSDYPDITKGDVLLSVDGMSIEDWEEKLSHYLSSGNPDVFRRDFARRILHGDSSTVIEIEYRDSLDEIKTFSAQRIEQYGEWYYDYYVNDSLKNTKWKKWDCNVGYVNMGILYTDDVYPMYNDLYQTKAIIFDVRNYPNGTISNIGSILFDQKTEFVRFTFPDMTYPGTFSWSGTNEIGRDGNPVSYMGKVIILCNANTQSHAEYTIMGLQAFPGAIVIGSPTAGADGNITRFYISKDIQAGYTSIGVFYPNGDPTQRIGIAIDSLIYPTAEGIRQGRDEVLEKALEIAGCEPICVEYENIAKSEQSIYPNPALDFIHTRGVNEECLISDLIGKVLWKGSVNESGRIPISNLDRGIYFFKTQSNSIMFIKI